MENNMDFVLNDTYKILGTIGSGGGGVIYKAWHIRLQKYVIIKELTNGVNQDNFISRTEVEALKNVKSPYLPQVFDFIVYNGHVMTVMEFIEGESFDKLLKQHNRFPQNLVIKWYEQLAEAIMSIHEKSIAHRDIKPANIMLQSNGNVCLIDFNAALVNEGSESIISRSLGYASPEQYELFNFRQRQMMAKQQNGFSPYQQASEQPEKINWFLSDIFSLGATMYQLLTGINPNSDATKNVPVSKLNANFSEGITYIIDKSMNISPSERFPSAEILLKAIKDIYKFDNRWKKSQIKKTVLAFVLPVTFAVFASTAIIGHRMISNEKNSQYYNIIYSIENDEDYEDIFQNALQLFPSKPDAYLSMAKRLYTDGNYEDCREFITRNLGDIKKIADNDVYKSTLADLYYIMGNACCSQSTPDYSTAAEYFNLAVSITKDNPAYYRDYAISLARTGKSERALTELEKAQALNMDDASLYLAKGEIKSSEKDNNKAIEFFNEAIRLSDDYSICWRAYCAEDDILKSENEYDASIELLTSAKSKVPQVYITSLNERLAQAYIGAQRNDEAIELLYQLIGSDVPKLGDYLNLSELLKNKEDFSEAEEILNKAESHFPKEYSIQMQKSYLEISKQARKSQSERNYKKAYEYFDKAKELYSQSKSKDDYDMNNLESYILQLKENGWN